MALSLRRLVCPAQVPSPAARHPVKVRLLATVGIQARQGVASGGVSWTGALASAFTPAFLLPRPRSPLAAPATRRALPPTPGEGLPQKRGGCTARQWLCVAPRGVVR